MLALAVTLCVSTEAMAELAVRDSMVKPTRIATGPGGKIYVSDPPRGSVFILGTNLNVIGQLRNVGYPIGLAVNPDGRIYVADDDRNRIEVWDENGIRNGILVEGVVDRPTDIALDFDGNLYIADSGKHSVLVFDPSGNYVTNIGSKGSGNGFLDFPIEVKIAYYLDATNAPIGELYVTDQQNHRVQVFDLQGNYIRKFGDDLPWFGDEWQGTLNFAQSTVVDDIYDSHVLDTYYSTIQIFDRVSANYVTNYSEAGDGLGQMRLPQDIVMTDDGQVIVANSGNGTVKVVYTTNMVTTILSSNIVDETAPIGTTVGTLSATGADGPATLVFVSGNGGVDNSSFEIVGNELRTTALLDYETKSSMEVKIKAAASNAVNLIYGTELYIQVIDMNDAPTNLFLLSRLYENWPIGTQAGRLTTADPDAGDTFTYTLVAGTGDADNGRFTISGDKLLTAEIFDHEVITNLNVRISTRDAAGAEFTNAFTVAVNNVGELDDPDTDGDQIPDWWEEAITGNPTGLVATADDDSDGYSNLDEWISLTDPEDFSSLLEISYTDLDITSSNTVLEWLSAGDRIYIVEFSTNLVSGSWQPADTNISATPPFNVYTDLLHSAESKGYLRLKVKLDN